MGTISTTIINALKYLAQIPDKEKVISPQAFGPIQKLKTEYLGSRNPRLHINEVLIALSMSAKDNKNAAKAMECLKSLSGLQAHFTSNIKSEDLHILHRLGIQATYEAERR